MEREANQTEANQIGGKDEHPMKACEQDRVDYPETVWRWRGRGHMKCGPSGYDRENRSQQ
jgi:hypothetical protein